MRRLKLKRTCFGCPEQYEAFDGDRQVGYLRLRHGHFTVQFPDHDGVVIYSACPMGDGRFNRDERVHFLNCACFAINQTIDLGVRDLKNETPIYDVEEPRSEDDE